MPFGPSASCEGPRAVEGKTRGAAAVKQPPVVTVPSQNVDDMQRKHDISTCGVDRLLRVGERVIGPGRPQMVRPIDGSPPPGSSPVRRRRNASRSPTTTNSGGLELGRTSVSRAHDSRWRAFSTSRAMRWRRSRSLARRRTRTLGRRSLLAYCSALLLAQNGFRVLGTERGLARLRDAPSGESCVWCGLVWFSQGRPGDGCNTTTPGPVGINVPAPGGLNGAAEASLGFSLVPPAQVRDPLGELVRAVRRTRVTRSFVVGRHHADDEGNRRRPGHRRRDRQLDTFYSGTAQERRARINGAVPATFEGPGCT